MTRTTALAPPAAALAACALAGLTGCRSYEPRPLDLDSTRSAWMARSPADPSVREFAATLDRAAGGPHADTFDPADGLTLAEAEVVALVFNPDLRQSRLEADVTRANAAHAGLWEDPVLGVNLERIVSGAGGMNSWAAGSTVAITIPISGRLEAEKSRAGAALAAELDQLAAKEWATRSATRELWVQWSAAHLRLEVTERLIERLRDVAALADRQERAGSMSRVDARLFRVELASQQADRIASAARVKELELQLRAMLGLSPNASTTLIPSVSITPRTNDPLELQRLMEATNPELAAVRSQYEVSEQSLRAEVRKQYPDLTIGPGYGSDQGDNRVLFGLSIAIPLWNRNQQGVAQATATREVARGQFETTYEHLATQLVIALTRFEAGRSQRMLVESTVVPLAEEQEQDIARVAALGRVDPLLLLESVKAQHAAKIRLLEARAAESIGATRLNELIGPAHVHPDPAATNAATPPTVATDRNTPPQAPETPTSTPPQR